MRNFGMKNSVDNESNSHQYLGVASLRLLQLGNDMDLGSLSRENRSRRKLHASKEKGCQEKETLTVRETKLRTNRKFRKASREKHLSGGFLIACQTAHRKEAYSSWK
jgi:hypothetical protein